MKKTWFGTILMAMATFAAGAQELEKTFSWLEVFADGTVPDGVALQPPAGDLSDHTLKVTGTSGRQNTVPLLVIDSPGVDSVVYAIEGRIRYDGVEGDAYLEMWNEFPDGSRFFSRTLGASGGMARLTGDSDWRAAILPFNRSGSELTPRRLEVSLVLPGAGTVEIGPLTLKEYDGMPAVLQGGGGNAWTRIYLVIAMVSAVGIVLGAIQLVIRRRTGSVQSRRMKALDT